MANRRPLKSRSSPLAVRLARTLATRGVTPNAISQAGIGMAALSGLSYWAAWGAGPLAAAALLVLGALFAQLRLVCNLLDGMVAIEGRRGAPDGAFWNEVPDRLCDLLILGGAGIAAGLPWLGLLATVLAVMTAHLREHGRAEGAAPDFGGPMAKPHRMALLTLGSLATALQVALTAERWLLTATLALVALGTALTFWRRAARLVRWMRGG
ncbi:CDP-alcohol phosphatidyltransferase family protein [Oceaniglobus roseus]|uniref:CDP-alcohol phosphatidyltransferase family protein n=1 Tax=Oceaniglobus roseus TaxID=1737570 RepID=UPI000C7ED461|nr:CDP-alcohol phosphatidyltransferase family protein [Kandeliimicrobium roseum]